MKCPHCNSEVQLTWKRYWAAPLGNYVCPSCGNPFRLKHSFRYYAIILGAAVVLGLIFTLLTRLFKVPFYSSLLLYTLCGLVLIVPLDRWIDTKWRDTEPVQKQEKQQ